MIRRIGVVILVLFVTMELSGCAGLKKKFTRKKKEEIVQEVYLSPEEYQKEPDEVLYKRHYLFWKTWHEDLMKNIGESYTTDNRCIIEIISNLEDMKKALTGKEAARLQLYIEDMKEIKGELVSRRSLTTGTKKRIGNRLRRAYREIRNQFAYKHAMKGIK